MIFQQNQSETHLIDQYEHHHKKSALHL